MALRESWRLRRTLLTLWWIGFRAIDIAATMVGVVLGVALGAAAGAFAGFCTAVLVDNYIPYLSGAGAAAGVLITVADMLGQFDESSSERAKAAARSTSDER
jgi:hypothetical protein